VADHTDDTTEEFEPLRTIRTRRASGASAGGQARTRPEPESRPDLDVEPEPEPNVTPGSLSRTLGHVALTALALAVLYTAWQHTRREPSDDGRSGDRAIEQGEEAGADPEVTTTLAGRGGTPVEPECPPEDGAAQPVRSFSGAPPTCIDLSRTYVATVETSRGSFQITLDAQAAPQTVNNFVFLSRWRYYEEAAFHRVVPGFVIDTGDPVGGQPPDDSSGVRQAGFGGPGYPLEDEPPPPSERPYPTRSVTTVRDDDGRTNGSQFSIVTGPAGESGPQPLDTVFGQVTSGWEVVQEIEATGNASGLPPAEPTVIRSISISER
jgi:cyclophilin family peptidyl-prolyl cis-trans isomerase